MLAKSMMPLVVAGIFAVGPTYVANAESLQNCRAIENASERLACYDQLADASSSAVPADSVEPEATPAATTVEPAAPVQEGMPETDWKKKEAEEFHARVTKCERDPNKKYLFRFEGGQVWKQVSSRRLSFRNCDFDVVVTKDFFGYEMRIDGENSKIRISRIR